MLAGNVGRNRYKIAIFVLMSVGSMPSTRLKVHNASQWHSRS
jgi:hypothetical protein